MVTKNKYVGDHFNGHLSAGHFIGWNSLIRERRGKLKTT